MSLAFPKFKADRTLQEERAERRSDRIAHETAEKRKVRARDFMCRWPRCECHRRELRTEIAHLDAKGMGGDHSLRTAAALIVRLCHPKHQGPRSLHSGDLRIDALTSDGANGPLAFWQRGPDGQFFLVAQETAPFMYARD